MTTRQRATRKNVPMYPEDLETVKALRSGEGDATEALRDLTGVRIDAASSEAETIHALVLLGRQALEEKVLDIGYQRLAEFVENDPECQAWRRSMRNRHLRPFNGAIRTDAA